MEPVCNECHLLSETTLVKLLRATSLKRTLFTGVIEEGSFHDKGRICWGEDTCSTSLGAPVRNDEMSFFEKCFLEERPNLRVLML